jgi:hypothetical protein
MRLQPNPARPTQRCKIKRVYRRLPLHVHSAVFEQFNGRALGNPGGEWELSPVALRGARNTLGRLTSGAR